MPAEHHPSAPMAGPTEHMRSRRIHGPQDGPRRTPTFFEWELRAAEWVDTHPHDEFDYVLQGELHVTAGGTTVIAGPGDLVRVPAGERGRYRAPVFARMLAVYDHSPDGAPSDIEGLTPLSP